ncbi:PQQ-binding-like beta-propeller repeat protein [Gryllotalpicola ginsengisoli]|uniref:PQQ-binding-like beta-propeller repeat protein n=1 Tax=Gryllotalpicola ginsengisoli TaxID=444608 RepID=UPI0003FBC7E4|nr:PQQ-binding-like beta-propeller repeat protein [Gryllotalpicola ginsengisoli]
MNRTVSSPSAAVAGLIAIGLVAALTGCGSHDAEESASKTAPKTSASASPTPKPQLIEYNGAVELLGVSGDGYALLAQDTRIAGGDAPVLESTFTDAESTTHFAVVDDTGTTVDWADAPQIDVFQARLSEAGVIVLGTSADSALGASGVVAALDPKTGATKWSVEADVPDSELSDDGCELELAQKSAVVLACEQDDDTAYRVLDASDGSERFVQEPTKLAGTSWISVADPTVAVYSDGTKNTISVVDEEGEPSSTFESEHWQPGLDSVSADSDTANYDPRYDDTATVNGAFPVTGYRDAKTVAKGTVSLIKQDGTAAWSVKTDGEVVGANDDYVVVTVPSTHKLVFLDGATGKVAKTVDAPAGSALEQVAQVAFVDDDTVAITFGGTELNYDFGDVDKLASTVLLAPIDTLSQAAALPPTPTATPSPESSY